MANVPLKRFVCFIQKRFFNTFPSKSPQAALTSATSETNSVVTPHQILSSFTVQYLVNSCGLPLRTAISTSKRVRLDEKKKEKTDSIISFLKSHNFSDTQVAKLIEKHPSVLHFRLSGNLEPKILFLAENGISGSVLPKILLLNPAILKRSLNSHLKPAFEFLKKYIGSSERIQLAIYRGPWLLTDVKNIMQRNVDHLIKQGLPVDRLRELIVLQPRCIYQNVDRIVYGVEKVKGLGLKPNDAMYIHALRVILSLSELSWKRKVGIFESMGWSYNDAVSTFVSNPQSFSCSEKKLRRAMDFLVNSAKFERESVIAYPKVLMYSVEKRIIPRYTIWKILVERKLIKGAKFSWIINISEKNFVSDYIMKYSDTIPDLMKIYQNIKETGNIVL